MADDWKKKLENGEPLPLDLVLNEEVLKKIGIGPSKVAAVQTILVGKGLETWGNLLDLKSEEKAIEATGGDDVSGERIWNFVQDQKAKAAAASKLSVFM